jgi:hypothetical protein
MDTMGGEQHIYIGGLYDRSMRLPRRCGLSGRADVFCGGGEGRIMDM